jgi:hypothetical protein
MKVCILLVLVGLALYCSGCAGAPRRASVPGRTLCWQPSFRQFGVVVKSNKRAYWGPAYLCGEWPTHLRRTR